MTEGVTVQVAASAGAVSAAEFRATAEAPTILYDGPSAKSKPQFLYGRDVPVEIIVIVEGWAKVRDAGGTIGVPGRVIIFTTDRDIGTANPDLSPSEAADIFVIQ